jgi:carboxyl-terminal processing protease
MDKKKTVFLTLSLGLMLTLLGAGLFGQTSQKGDIYRYLSIFNEVFSLVRNNYVEDVPSTQLIDGAFTGATDAVDEFSFYVPPAQMSAFRAADQQSGIPSGLVLSKRYGYALVISAIAGSPADHAGIEPGDLIEQVDGVPTQKLAIWQIESLLRKKNNGPVKVQVVRGGMAKREEFAIDMKAFEPEGPSLKYYGQVAYIKVPNFLTGTSSRLAELLSQARVAGRKKLIIDVRDNAAGSYDEAIATADELLNHGTITSLVGRRVESRHWDADAKTDFDGDLEVLTDQSTAAGAEVFAAAIHGNTRGKLVGVPTYGMSVVQKFVDLPSGGGLFVTVGHYSTPDLKPIKEQGIRPDQLVDLAVGSIHEEKKGEATKPKDDLILRKALLMFGEQPEQMKAAA